MRARHERSTRGSVLVLVLVMVAIMAMVAASELFVARGETAASAAARDGHHARAAAMSGIHRVLAVLSAARDEMGEPIDLRDNPEIFQAQALTGEETGWHFTVFADNLSDPENVRYGLEEEAAKINLNIASDDALKALGLTDELVDCLRDYQDTDSAARENGAEQDYYDQLSTPYLIRNGPLLSLEEVLLVKGFDGSVVYGEDANRNGLLEGNENDGQESFPPDDGDGQLNRGLRCFATAISYEPDVDSEGVSRININTEDPNALAQRLAGAGVGTQTADFIVQARGQNVNIPDPSSLLGMTIEVQAAQAGTARSPRGRRGRAAAGAVTRTYTLSSGVGADNLPAVMDKLTSGGISLNGQAILPGRVNLNSALIEVLSALDGIDENIAQEIIDTRDTLDEMVRSTTAWLYTEGVVSAETFKTVAPLLTTRSYQYRVRSFGYRPEGGRFCVLEAVIDTASGEPRIKYLRELTRLGVPFTPGGEER